MKPQAGGLPPPVVILSSPRSFSTVVGAMLGQHPQLYGLAELHLFSADRVGDISAFQFRTYPHGLLRVLAERQFGGQTDFNVIRAKRWLIDREQRPTDEVFRHVQALVAPARCVEKSISTNDSPENLARMLACCPDAHFLHLVRHPRPQCESVLDLVSNLLAHSPKLRDAILDYDTSPPTADPQRYWLRLNRNILELLRQVPPGRQRRIRGEDLLQDPDGMLPELCRWLGVRDDAAAIEAMKHPETSAYARPGPPNARFGGDPKFMASPALRRPNFKEARLDGPLAWRPDREFLPEVRELAAEFGYS